MAPMGDHEGIEEEHAPHAFNGGVLRAIVVASRSNQDLTIHVHVAVLRQSPKEPVT